MNRAIWLTIVGVLAFCAILIARLPASWVVPGHSANFACADAQGTVWNGTCVGASVQQQAIGDVSWQMHPARLLAGKLDATVILTRPAGLARARVELGLHDELTAREVRADLPLDRTLIPQLPAGMHGHIHANLALLRVVGRTVKAVEGTIEARDLEQGAGADTQPLGSYSLEFPAGADNRLPTGALRDLGGPLEVQGSIRLTPEPGFDLQALVKARADAPAELAREIQYLGSPDAQGRRPFSLAATF
ncbi:MAG TPA: type II secretion system protein N [Steroidobacteraceae bacterium]